MPLLLKRLHLDQKKIVTSAELKSYCQKLDLDYYTTIRYLTHHRYVHTVLRGIFYLPSLEERKLQRMDLSHLEALAKALKMKGVRRWYWGLETALRLNGITHEFFATDTIMNDTIFRAKPVTVLGHAIKFIKLKRSLFGFGIIRKKVNFSDPEKTLLDMIYLSRYQGLADKEIKMKVYELWGHCSKNKIVKYARNYNRTVQTLVRKQL